MEAGGEEQWTTIDRKTSKKKSKQEEKPVIEEGWEQVSKKEKRTKKDSVSNIGQKNDKSRNGDRYGGGRGGRGADGGSNKGTLPRKNSSKPPRGEGGRGRGGGGGGGGGGRRTQSPAAAVGRGSSRGVTPQPSAAPPAPASKNTWAAKISGNTSSSSTSSPAPEETPPVAQPPAKFSWANLTSSVETDTTNTTNTDTVSTGQSEPPDVVKMEEEDEEVSREVTSQPTNIPATVEKTEENTETSVEMIDTTDATVDKIDDKEESLEENNDNKHNSTVISGPDSNGNFEADDNNFNNNTDGKCLEEDKVSQPSLLNGDLEAGEEETGGEEAQTYKDDHWSPLNMEGKKQYDRDFLISLQATPLALQKPETLPSNMDVILNTPNPDTIRSITSAPNLNNMFDRHDRFVRQSHSQRGTPR